MSFLLHNAPRPMQYDGENGYDDLPGVEWLSIRLRCFQVMTRLGRGYKQLEWAVSTAPGVQVEWDGIEEEIDW